MDNSIKYKIVEKIILTTDEVLLNEIKSLVDLSEGDFWNDLPKEVKESITQAKTELDNGKGLPHANVMAEARERYTTKFN